MLQVSAFVFQVRDLETTFYPMLFHFSATGNGDGDTGNGDTRNGDTRIWNGVGEGARKRKGWFDRRFHNWAVALQGAATQLVCSTEARNLGHENSFTPGKREIVWMSEKSG